MGAEVSGGTATVIAWMIKLDQSALDAPGDQIAQSAEDAVNRGIAAANGQASRRSGRDSGRRIRQSHPQNILDLQFDIVAGAGPTVGSSLFGPHRGCSLVPIARPGNDEGDQLKRAIQWQDSEAVPRRSRRTDHLGPHPNTHPMRQRMAYLIASASNSVRAASSTS